MKPLRQSNFSAARISPTVPSWIRSMNGRPEPAVALGDRHDEAQVRLDHVLLGVVVAALDPLGKLDFLLRGQQRGGRDAVQE